MEIISEVERIEEAAATTAVNNNNSSKKKKEKKKSREKPIHFFILHQVTIALALGCEYSCAASCYDTIVSCGSVL
jgi:hypothetical protein